MRRSRYLCGDFDREYFCERKFQDDPLHADRDASRDGQGQRDQQPVGHRLSTHLHRKL